ncbi:hypothetical protein GcC1_124006 [Golovinomyces cichoracearum]|uniref:Uncharacterized protein n=1 Tax=Golovinomyces cichoracearum TaxID=62708 RepID=A0A420I685_9PEZI|nr:hypothetical protein GcC1_124006 [Golovinomyces cichoracearum]
MSSSIQILTRNPCEEKDTSQSSSSLSYFSPPRKSLSRQLDSAIQSPMTRNYSHERRPSLLSSSLSKQEHTVVNVGDPDGVPRLITCVRSSQGYEWNPGILFLHYLHTNLKTDKESEIFLPSYVDFEFESLDRKRDPVHEIRLSDEETKKILPQFSGNGHI